MRVIGAVASLPAVLNAPLSESRHARERGPASSCAFTLPVWPRRPVPTCSVTIPRHARHQAASLTAVLVQPPQWRMRLARAMPGGRRRQVCRRTWCKGTLASPAPPRSVVPAALAHVLAAKRCAFGGILQLQCPCSADCASCTGPVGSCVWSPGISRCRGRLTSCARVLATSWQVIRRRPAGACCPTRSTPAISCASAATCRPGVAIPQQR